MTKTATGTLRRTSARSHCKTVSLHIEDQLFAKGCCCMIAIPQGFFPLSARFSSMPVSTTKRRCVYFPSTISCSAFVGWEVHREKRACLSPAMGPITDSYLRKILCTAKSHKTNTKHRPDRTRRRCSPSYHEDATSNVDTPLLACVWSIIIPGEAACSVANSRPIESQ